MNTPRIIKESSDGFRPVELLDELFSRRELQCFGKLDREAAYSLSTQLLYLAREEGRSPATLYIDSPEGERAGGISLCDMISGLPFPVVTVCTGTAAGPAALLLACGTKRLLLPHARVSLFDPEAGGKVGFLGKSGAPAGTRETAAVLLAARCGMTVEESLSLMGKDEWLTPEKALALHLCDKIIEKLEDAAYGD